MKLPKHLKKTTVKDDTPSVAEKPKKKAPAPPVEELAPVIPIARKKKKVRS